MTPFAIAFHHATPHGILAAVHLPDSSEPVPTPVLDRLHPAEAAQARTLGGYRQVSFVGGRLALAAAVSWAGAPVGPILPDDRGAPRLPRGWTGSVSHKRTLAVGMIARDVDGTLGCDLEDYGPPREGIAERVLRPEELDEVMRLPAERRWISILLRFSLKEALYKALDPHVRRWVGFHEVAVHPELQGRARLSLHLAAGEGPFEASARYDWLHGRVLTSVRLTAPTR